MNHRFGIGYVVEFGNISYRVTGYSKNLSTGSWFVNFKGIDYNDYQCVACQYLEDK